MEIRICITKEDVKIKKLGDNYEISLPKGIFLNFTKDAVNEFVNGLIRLDIDRVKAI